MKKISLILASAMVVFTTSCKNASNEENQQDDHVEANDGESPMQSDMLKDEESEEKKELTVTLEPKSDSNLSGTATFTEENGEVTIEATINGLAEGKHAIHLHEKADCSATDGTSAGGHWNPTAERHGKWGDEEGHHRGDIGNFEVNSDGVGTVTFSTDQWCIGCDDEKKNIVGKAVIVHDGVDDYESQPSGDAGTRVGCGVIKM